MKIHFVGKSLWFMQTNNGVKQRFLDCFLKLLDKKRKKWRELLLDQYVCWSLLIPFFKSWNKSIYNTDRTLYMETSEKKTH